MLTTTRRRKTTEDYSSLSWTLLICLLGLCLFSSRLSSAYDPALPPIKVGILHSLTGDIGPSETPLHDLVEFLVNITNSNGGILNRRVESISVDPASNWPRFATLARTLLVDDQVDVVFGCWTSVSRKSVLSVFEELNGLLFYPVQYEGEECSKNIIYTGAAPNQQSIPAARYLLSLGYTRFVLLGTDYVFPRTCNTILREFLLSQGVTDDNILEIYTPFFHSDWLLLVQSIVDFKNGPPAQPTAIISTINGVANTYFYAELSRQGITAADIPVIAMSVGEVEFAALDPASLSKLVGQLAAWNYFQSDPSTENQDFLAAWHSVYPGRVTNDPMEATYIGWKLWRQAVLQAGTTDVDTVLQALYGQKTMGLTGNEVQLLDNHHLVKPVYIGEIQANGQFNPVYSEPPLAAQPWSPFNGNPVGTVCNWTYPYVCSKCVAPTYQPFHV